ncbi:MAG: hypothetical protein K8R02_06130 [Anaerohalosphaeraceae bacterium]|nr:hypothetical protein [Anaerohalosphaeraceae bacterium]
MNNKYAYMSFRAKSRNLKTIDFSTPFASLIPVEMTATEIATLQSQ